jgi:hypothetical protein
MGRYIFLDIETKNAIDEKNGILARDLDISISITYDYQLGYRTWFESDSKRLINYLSNFEHVIGFNIIEFDFEVLKQYDDYNKLNLIEDRAIDLLFLIELQVGYKVSLNSIATTTLSTPKLGNGIDAVALWKNRQIHRLIRYCKEDVRITMLVFEHIQRNGYVLFDRLKKLEKINIQLPNTAMKIEVDIQEYRRWFENYFDCLSQADSISPRQIETLREKTIRLVDDFDCVLYFDHRFENYINDQYEDSEEDDNYVDDDEEEYDEEEYDEEDEEDEEDDQEPSRPINRRNLGSQVDDDFPF